MSIPYSRGAYCQIVAGESVRIQHSFSFTSITPLEIAISLHISRTKKKQSVCSHQPVVLHPVVGNSGILPPEVLITIFLFADLKTLIQAAEVNDVIRNAAREAFKTLVKEKMKPFFSEDTMPQFFAQLRRARAIYVAMCLCQSYFGRTGNYQSYTLPFHEGGKRAHALDCITRISGGTGVSAYMTFMTESAFYSLYTDVHERGLVLVDERHPGQEYGGHGLSVCLNGNGMGEDCGVYCCRKLRRWPADEGRIFSTGEASTERGRCVDASSSG
ncbi:hypothetical protein IMY05_C4590000500 [Salix suchowensis]|nr:hypothetical protein IMY05_C4590000500 [Salix suchowensis]